jgi:hypothetical protein
LKEDCVHKVESMRRMSSLALRWILVTGLTASPLLAYPPQEGAVVAADGGMVQVLDENKNPLVGTSILSTVLMDSPGRVSALSLQDTNAIGEITTGRTARELGKPAAPPAPDQKRAEPGGKTWSELIVAALIAGGVVALILLLRGDHKGSPGVAAAPAAPRVQSPPPTTGTILTPGTPTVSSPR